MDSFKNKSYKFHFPQKMKQKDQKENCKFVANRLETTVSKKKLSGVQARKTKAINTKRCSEKKDRNGSSEQRVRTKSGVPYQKRSRKATARILGRNNKGKIYKRRNNFSSSDHNMAISGIAESFPKDGLFRESHVQSRGFETASRQKLIEAIMDKEKHLECLVPHVLSYKTMIQDKAFTKDLLRGMYAVFKNRKRKLLPCSELIRIVQKQMDLSKYLGAAEITLYIKFFASFAGEWVKVMSDSRGRFILFNTDHLSDIIDYFDTLTICEALNMN